MVRESENRAFLDFAQPEDIATREPVRDIDPEGTASLEAQRDIAREPRWVGWEIVVGTEPAPESSARSRRKRPRRRKIAIASHCPLRLTTIGDTKGGE